MQGLSAKHYVDTEHFRRLAAMAAEISEEIGVCRYPLNPLRLAHQRQIRVVSYEKLSALSGNTLPELLRLSQDGFSLYKDGTCLVAFNGQIRSKGRRRWTLLHEISHILLGHVGRDRSSLETLSPFGRERLEADADDLASCLIAPFGVAHLCNIQSAGEMKAVFGLSSEAAAYFYRDLCALRESGRIEELLFQKSLSLCIGFISTRLTLQYRLKNNALRPAVNLNIACDGDSFS